MDWRVSCAAGMGFSGEAVAGWFASTGKAGNAVACPCDPADSGEAGGPGGGSGGSRDQRGVLHEPERPGQLEPGELAGLDMQLGEPFQ